MTAESTTAPARHEPELAGQTVVVIGGSSGIGLETARRARAEGADVILTARDPDRMRRVGLELGARTAAFDATDFERLRRFFDDLPTPIAVQNPLTSLADDVAATKRVIDAQSGPVILVGHSWGGTVITEAGDHAKVAALVYVAAFAPDVGEATSDLGKGGPPPPGSASIRPDTAGFLYLTPEGVAKDFAQDLPAAQTAVMAVTQGPIFGKTFDEKVRNAAWKSKPSWYIVAEKDRMIQPDLERAMSKKINAKTTVLPTSHVSMLSRPNDVAAVILAAAGAVKQ